jgi:small subunit ribosomal protein S4e
LLRDILKILEKGKEARTIIKRGDILVDGKIRKDHAYPVGLFDVVTIPAIGKSFRAVPSEKVMSFIEISEGEAKTKICKIVGKKILKKGEVQLNLHDGRNIITDKKDYKTGDSIFIELPITKIVEHLPLNSGAIGIVTKGADVGKIGKVKEVTQATSKEHAKVMCEFDGEEEEVLKERFFVIGKGKPAIKIS